MMRSRSRWWLVMLGLVPACCGAANAAEPANDDAENVRVMSFNIRYGTAKDGVNHWNQRKDFLVETVKAFHPDLLGTQETLAFQRDYLAEKLPEFDHIGVGRTDGREDGEMMALYYKRDRFEKLDGGHFWLSETPDKVGSKSWDSSLPRMVTWVKLRDRKRADVPHVVFLNMHFDHMGKTARLESGRLLRQRAAALGKGCSVIITGDFNSGEASEPYQALFNPVDNQPSQIVDTYRIAHPDKASEEGTATGFLAANSRGARIDWIGVSRDWEVRSATIDRTSKEGRTPSDHFPVTAVLHGKVKDGTVKDGNASTGSLRESAEEPSDLASKAKLSPSSNEVFVYCSAAQDQALDVLRMDLRTGALAKIARLQTPGEPAALATSPDGPLLFASMRSTGKLASFRVDPASGKLTPINVVEAGADPAQLSVDRTGHYLLTAYYVAAKVSVHRIAADGSLSEQPVQELPTVEKAHSIVLDASNRFAFVPHTGPNTIFQFAWNEQSGRLTPLHPEKLVRPDHTGPRHLAWHPSKPIAYIDNEQSSSVTAYELNQDGTLKPGRTISTLPSGFRGTNSTAEIKVHPSGRFLYVSNRGHDSLAVIGIDKTGTELTFIATEPTEKTPRSFDIDPSGQFLLAAGESSGRLAISRITPETGRLTLIHTETIGPKLWWVKTLGKR
jgi:6-phosphogluconolactonase (cycloisomerase 2 family)/endonuclease/exonuclease/phosphatase family metal-dependent hydrolase